MMCDIKTKRLVKNTMFLYIMTFVKLVLPLITLPYLTRVLSKDAYGVVSYVKSCMAYVQLIIDCGFILSATKEVVEIFNSDDADVNKKLGRVVGNVYAAKLSLMMVSGVFLAVLCAGIDLLRANLLFTWLYFIAVALNIFIPEFLFRGIEKMEAITVSYVVAKVISTGLTLFFVKSDTNVLVIPILEIIGTLSAVIFSSVFVKRLQISISFSKPIVWWWEIKASLVFFSSNIATTAFGALNTVLIGIFLSKADVAYWSIAFQLVTAVQTMYSPITNSLYPHMLQEKSRKIIKRIMRLIMPIITVGCVFCLIFADWIMGIVAGKQYVDAAPLFQMLVPLMFISFPAILYGWPVLGAINKNKETAFSTIIAAMIQVLGIVVLGIASNFGVYQLAIVRIASETTLFGIRYVYYRKNIGCFVD